MQDSTDKKGRARNDAKIVEYQRLFTISTGKIVNTISLFFILGATKIKLLRTSIIQEGWKSCLWQPPDRRTACRVSHVNVPLTIPGSCASLMLKWQTPSIAAAWHDAVGAGVYTYRDKQRKETVGFILAASLHSTHFMHASVPTFRPSKSS